jgi:hypothetical protein
MPRGRVRRALVRKPALGFRVQDLHQSRSGYPSIPPISVLQPNNIVLAQIGADLDFNKGKRDLAWVVEPVGTAEGQIDTFVLSDQVLFGVKRDQCGAGNNHPMLGAVMVFLQ